jgi:hypothetical protein
MQWSKVLHTPYFTCNGHRRPATVKVLSTHPCVCLAAHLLRALEAYHAAIARSHLQDSYDQFGRPISFF